MSTEISLSIFTLFPGIRTFPVPIAVSIRSLFVTVFVILPPAISICFKNASLDTLILSTVTLPVTVFPFVAISPVCVIFPVYDKLGTVSFPASRSLSTSTLLSASKILPVPLATNSKSALLAVVVMTLSNILISAMFASLTNISFQP